jgi:hypothetical protein
MPPADPRAAEQVESPPLRPTTGLASLVNPYAGMHPITLDPDELEAARRAGELSIQHFPYYVRRFGERGRLFGYSDGAWLVTLCAGMGEANALQEITWLWNVLASRGMPGLLLGKHLEFLEECLREVRPDASARWAVLGTGAAHLRRLRTRHLSEADLERIGRDFARHVDGAWDQRLPRMGEILAAAVADEAAGIEKAVSSIVEWATDAERFPESWTRAVEDAVTEARKRLIS